MFQRPQPRQGQQAAAHHCGDHGAGGDHRRPVRQALSQQPGGDAPRAHADGKAHRLNDRHNGEHDPHRA